MVKFYKITKEESGLVPDFHYQDNDVNCLFTLKSGEQTDGSFIVREDLVINFQDKLTAIDFTNKTLYTIDQLSPKQIKLI